MPATEWIAWSWSSLQGIGLTGLFQIAVLACAIYGLFLFFRGTSGAQVMIGLLLLLLVLIGLTQL